jgi:hypothetical protein
LGGLSLYSYVSNNPVNSTDPRGLFVEADLFWINVECEDSEAYSGVLGEILWANFLNATDPKTYWNDIVYAFNYPSEHPEEVITFLILGELQFGRAALSSAAAVPDRGGLTKAGRALQKHGSRPGSAFPSARGNPVEINRAAQKVVDEIVHSPGAKRISRFRHRYGRVVEIRAPDGRGVRYDAKGNFIGFLEP